MRNLQDLYDFYIRTRPSPGKMKSGTALLIHLCKALNVSSPEEISEDYFPEILESLEHYFGSAQNKAIQDKSMLAEMIGRYGPVDGFEVIFDGLLNDRDENLCQFTLYSLEYCGMHAPDKILPYIERFKDDANPLMNRVAAHLASKVLCSPKADEFKPYVKKWISEGDINFTEEIKTTLQTFTQRRAELSSGNECQRALIWVDHQLKHGL